jgi:3'-phosphoadenosine 5'-phosphosulfate sulfotransferase (PAPS reductase)/FAD synthetase
VEILHPKETFFALVRRNGPPTRRARFCCGALKEYKVLDNAIQGIRRSESTARAKRYKEPVVCRFYGAKKNHVNVFLPILEWTDDDVEQFIAKQKIQCHPLYYDEKGAFHVERRLGCIGCPLKSDKGKADFLMYPKFFKTLADNCVIWMRNHPQVKSIKKFGDAYGLIYHNLFCDSYDDFLYKTQTDLWGNKLDCKEYLERYFNITL